jgi:hypothetical protein
MEHGRRTSWTGGPRPQHVPARGGFRTSRVDTLIVSPPPTSACYLHSTPKISSQMPLENAELNRQIPVFRNAVTHRKQRVGTRSNRQRNQIWKPDNLGTTSVTVRTFRGAFLAFSTGLPRAAFAKGSVCISTFLTGSALQTEFAVTHSKQSTGTFLTGSRIASKAPGKSSNIDTKLSEERAWLRL